MRRTPVCVRCVTRAYFPRTLVESQQKDIPKLTRPHIEQYIYYRQGMKGSALENGEKMMEEVLAVSLFTETSTPSTKLASALSDVSDEFWNDDKSIFFIKLSLSGSQTRIICSEFEGTSGFWVVIGSSLRSF